MEISYLCLDQLGLHTKSSCKPKLGHITFVYRVSHSRDVRINLDKAVTKIISLISYHFHRLFLFLCFVEPTTRLRVSARRRVLLELVVPLSSFGMSDITNGLSLRLFLCRHLGSVHMISYIDVVGGFVV